MKCRVGLFTLPICAHRALRRSSRDEAETCKHEPGSHDVGLRAFKVRCLGGGLLIMIFVVHDGGWEVTTRAVLI